MTFCSVHSLLCNLNSFVNLYTTKFTAIGIDSESNINIVDALDAYTFYLVFLLYFLKRNRFIFMLMKHGAVL